MHFAFRVVIWTGGSDVAADAESAVLNHVSAVDQGNYPELLRRAYIINAPFTFKVRGPLPPLPSHPARPAAP